MDEFWQYVSGYTILSDYSDSDSSTTIINKTMSSITGTTLSGEKNSQYIRFYMDRYYDGIDLSEKLINICYTISSSGEGGSDAPINVMMNYTQIVFGWLVPYSVTSDVNTVTIGVVCTGTQYGEEYIYKTKTNTYTVEQGFVCGQGIDEPDINWYEQFLIRLQGTVDDYENYIDTKATETVIYIDDKIGDFDSLDARLDSLIVDGTPTEGNTELIDIRTGYDGTVYETAGTSVRSQVEDLDEAKYDKEMVYTKQQSDNRHASAIWLKQQSSNEMVQGIYPADGSQLDLTIYGKSTQDGEGDPSPENIRPIHGVGMYDKTITLDGTEKWVSDTTGTLYFVSINRKPNTSQYEIGVGLCSHFTNDTVFEARLKEPYQSCSFYGSNLYIRADNADNLKAYLAAQFAANTPVTSWYQSTEYETATQFYNGISVTRESGEYRGHITPVSEPLRGLPVTSGGNYTDADGQQYICDTYNTLTGVRTNNIQGTVFDGTETATVSDLSETYADTVRYLYGTGSNATQYATAHMCSHLDYINTSTASYGQYAVGGAGIIYLFLQKSVAGGTLTEVQAYLANLYSQGNPITVLFVKDTPTTEQLDPVPLVMTQSDKYSPELVNVITSEGEFDCGFNQDGTYSYKQLLNAVLDAEGSTT